MTEDDTLQQFKRLFWEVRRITGRKRLEEAARKSRELAEFARAHDLNAEAQLAEASLLERQKKYDDAQALLLTLLEDPQLRLESLAWHLLGRVHDGKKEYDPAIKYYDMALNDPNYDTPGNAWHNIGFAYYNKKEYDRAIECFRKALAAPNYDTPGYAWHNMGIAYGEKKEYDRAIECFHKALADPNYDTPGYAWNNMGFAHYEKKDYDGAIDCYRKALDAPNFDMPGKAWHNMGIAYREKKEYDRAIECWEKAREEYQKTGDTLSAQFLDGLIAAARVKAADRSSKDAALLEAVPQRAEAIESATERLIKKYTADELTIYEQYVRDFDPGAAKKRGDILAILKGWGSASPLIAGGSTGCRGGGYFLKWDNKGVVIDPGFDFLTNFHQMGFHCLEINAVIVSHNHPDHNDDLRPLDVIGYEMRKLQEKSRAKSGNKWNYVLIWDEDTAQKTSLDPRRAKYRRTLKFRSDEFQYNKTPSFNLRDKGNLPFDLVYFRARHAPEVEYPVSFYIHCFARGAREPGIKIGFTCDTGFHNDLCDEEHFGACDILVAHISNLSLENLAKEDVSLDKHLLGFLGVEELITGCKPKLTIVCEFKMGQADLRISIIQALRERCQTSNILPGGIGLFINPKTLEIQCTNCEQWRALEKITVGSPDQSFGPLKYFCENCRL